MALPDILAGQMRMNPSLPVYRSRGNRPFAGRQLLNLPQQPPIEPERLPGPLQPEDGAPQGIVGLDVPWNDPSMGWAGPQQRPMAPIGAMLGQQQMDFPIDLIRNLLASRMFSRGMFKRGPASPFDIMPPEEDPTKRGIKRPIQPPPFFPQGY